MVPLKSMANSNLAGLQPGSQQSKMARKMLLVKKYMPFYFMFLPALIIYVLFHYLPLWGIRIAFYEYGIFGIKYFKGLENFYELFASESFWRAFINTLLISGTNLVLGMFCSVVLSLLLNEVKNGPFKKLTQTIVYLPHFLSWVVVASIFTMILSPQTGVVNSIIKSFGGEPIYFLAKEEWWRPIFLMIYRWKETGWGTIIFLAALSAADPELYEAAWIDGASRLKQVWYITLPTIRTTILVVFIMNLSSIFNMFESVFVVQNPLVYKVSDVIQTYTYRTGLVQADFDYATAVGLFNSVLSFTLVIIANKLSKIIQGESIL